MKKYLATAMVLLVLVALVACNNNGATEGDNSNATELSPIPHVGVAHETHGIVFALDLPNTNWQVRSIQIGADHGGFGYGDYTLTVFYEPHSDFEGEISEHIPEAFFENTAERLFDLIRNLQAVTFSVNNERTVGDAIVGYDYRFSITRSGTRKAPPTANLPLEELKVQIDVATDELLSTFANLSHADVSVPGQSEGVSLVIWANQPLPNFSVTLLTHDSLEDSDEWGFRPTDSFGSVEMLLPGEAFVIKNYMGLGILPHRGISFTDTNGENTRVFFFQENHAYPEHGGQWIIQEIEADRLIWGFSYDVDMPSENGYAIAVS